MEFGIVKKLLTSTFLLFFLGATALREAINLATQGIISWVSVIPVAIIGGIQQGFIETYTLIFNFKMFVTTGLGGNIFFGLFKVAALWLFIFMITYMIWDTATGPEIRPYKKTALLSLAIVIVGALLFGKDGNSILLVNTVDVMSNLSNSSNTTISNITNASEVWL